MSDARTTDFAAEIRDCAERYLDQVEAAATYAPMALATYETDRTAFHRDVRQVGRIESECDDLLDEIRTLLGGSMQPNFTGVYLQSGSVLDLFVAIDRVVNRIETFLTDLAAIEPALSFSVRRDLVRMAETTAEATTLLATATGALLDGLCLGGDYPEIDTVVTEIGALESRCDNQRTKIVADAFARNETAAALVVRELATALDAAADAVEDAADRLSFVASTVVSLDGYGDGAEPRRPEAGHNG